MSNADIDKAPEFAWDDLAAFAALPRLGNLRVSPDGQTLIVTVSSLNPDATAYTSALWRVDLSGAQRPPRRLTRSAEGETAAALLADGSLLFTSSRQLPAHAEPMPETVKALWCLPADGGEAYVLATRDGGWESVVTAPQSNTVVFSAPVHQGCADDQEDAAKRAERSKRKVTAILHETTGVRAWDHDLGPEAPRLFTAHVVTAAEQAPERVDGTLSADGPRPLSGDIGRHLAGGLSLSDDGSVLVTGWTTARPHGVHWDGVAVFDTATGGRQIIELADAELTSPLVSPDGTAIACVRAVPGTPTQAPTVRLHLLDVASGTGRDLVPDWDRWGTPVAFSPDGRLVYVVADEDGNRPIFAIDLDDGTLTRLTDEGSFASVVLSPEGDSLYAVRSSLTDPGTLVRIDTSTHRLEEVPGPVRYPTVPGRVERVETPAADGTRVPGYLVMPLSASPAAPAPLALWIHGGPLNSWNDWSWRWCPWLLASRGYAVLLPDPALSTGYGQHMIQRGWGRWGGAPAADVLALTDAVVARSDIDASRTVAMGGSFGGYLANWLAGHTDRFTAIVSHASLWNLSSFLPTTDAPWHWAREMSASMQHDNSPHHFADHIHTPMLVIHGDRDYRVPIGEGLSLWWALASRFPGDPADMPHKFLYFPDENHWVLTPQHAVVWYETVLAFLDGHVHGTVFVRPGVL